MKLLKDYTTPDFTIEQVHLRIELKEENTCVHSELVIKRNKDVKSLILDGEEQQLVSLAIDNKILSTAEYEINATQLIIFSVPDSFVLKITSIIQPQNNTALSGLYRSNGLFCTQCEAQGFRRISYYLDRPDVMSLFTTTLVADKQRYPILLSNGNKVGFGDLEEGRHWVQWHDPFKKPAYLFAMVAGQLAYIQDSYVTQSNRTIELVIYVPLKHNTHHCGFAMEALKKAMHWDEKTYGLEYDLDIYMIVAVDDFNMGAMENKGLNIFNSQYILVDQKTATDFDFQNVLRVIGHEYFHNWTGNRVTLRDWFQLSLKEGLTVFREQQFFEEYTSIVSRINDVRLLRTRQFSEDSGPLAHPVRPESYIEIDNFYTATVYEKGAEVIRMLETLLGEEKFKEGLALYFKRHDGQAVTIDDFLEAFSTVAGISLTQFKRWYSQAGTPQVEVIPVYDEKTQVFSLRCRQFCHLTPDHSPKEPWVIPIAVQLMTPKGEKIPLSSDQTVLILNQREQVFSFKAIAHPPIPSLLRHFSAPVKLEYPYFDDQLMMLIAHDNDLFNRWDACVQLFMRCIKNPASVEYLIQALSQVLSDSLTGQLQDKAFVAELLSLPSFAYLVEELSESDNSNPIDITELLKHRRTLIGQVAYKLFALLADSYQQSNQDEEGARALKNACLYLISQSIDSSHQAWALQWAIKQYATARNMTEEIGALEVIKNHQGSQREQLLNDFYDRYQSYPLVVNKWLSLQARSQIPSVLDNIKTLMHHPDFNILTPNHVYALIGNFERANPEYFHQGRAGYDFLAACIIQIDPKNSNVAAHLAKGLLSWKRWTPPHAQWMKQALEAIQKQPVLSKGLSEVVSKALHE